LLRGTEGGERKRERWRKKRKRGWGFPVACLGNIYLLYVQHTA